MTWFFVMGSNLLIPLIMLIGGIIMYKRCPKNINHFLGYRTTRSMKNEETWRFAHEYCGKLWIKLSLVLIPLTILAHLPFYKSSEGVVNTAGVIISIVLCAILIVAIFPTELALKRNFDENGNRK